MLRYPAALIFDMDGLLIDSEPVSERALDEFLGRRRLDLDPDLNGLLLGKRLPDAILIIKDWYDLDGELADLLTELSETRINALRRGIPVMDGAIDILEWAQNVGMPRALATSSRRSHADVALEVTGLKGFFTIEVTGDNVQHGKPAPDLFLLAASRLGVEPAACLVFEDAPAGVAAARAAGMQVIWVPNAHTRGLEMPAEPDHTVASLFEPLAWLEAEHDRIAARVVSS
jgi:beta-phosphoglucomutase-like phosphatase (HAD superfamily)